MEPKDLTKNTNFKGFSNTACPFWKCHSSVKREFNCLFCYCPLAFLECPGPYKVFTDKNGHVRKDCTDCTLNHDGYAQSWNFIQRWLNHPFLWDGSKQSTEKRRSLIKRLKNLEKQQ